VQSKPGRRKISDIKLMKEDPAGVEKMTEEIQEPLCAAVSGLTYPHGEEAAKRRLEP